MFLRRIDRLEKDRVQEAEPNLTLIPRCFGLSAVSYSYSYLLVPQGLDRLH